MKRPEFTIGVPGRRSAAAPRRRYEFRILPRTEDQALADLVKLARSPLPPLYPDEEAALDRLAV